MQNTQIIDTSNAHCGRGSSPGHVRLRVGCLAIAGFAARALGVVGRSRRCGLRRLKFRPGGGVQTRTRRPLPCPRSRGAASATRPRWRPLVRPDGRRLERVPACRRSTNRSSLRRHGPAAALSPAERRAAPPEGRHLDLVCLHIPHAGDGPPSPPGRAALRISKKFFLST